MRKSYRWKFDLGKLRLARTQKGLSQGVVEDALDKTKGWLSRKENGLSPITIDEIERLSNIYDLDIAYFFSPSVEESSKSMNYVVINEEEFKSLIKKVACK